MKWKCLTGDAADVNEEVAVDWQHQTLKPLIARYNENDIFNADEAELFFRMINAKMENMGKTG